MRKLIAGAATTAALLAGPAAHAEAQNTQPATEINTGTINPDVNSTVAPNTDVPVSIPGGENPTILTTPTTGIEASTSTTEASGSTTSTTGGTTPTPKSTTSQPQETPTTKTPTTRVAVGGGVTTSFVPNTNANIGPTPTEQDENLPNTGTDPTPLVVIGGSLALSGLGAAQSNRNRKRGS